MFEGSLVRPHVLKMIGFITRLEQLGWTMDHDLSINLILTSLLECYSQFVLNFNINKIQTTFSGLWNMLAQAKKTIVKEKTFDPSCLFQESVLQKEEKTKKDEGITSKVLKPNGGVKKDKEDVKCHHYEPPRHWRRNCKEYIEFVKGKKMKGASGTKSYDDLFFPLFGI